MAMDDAQIKSKVRQFYDEVGWQPAGAGRYQNARYEDLRPVAAEYIHRCHLRVNRHLSPSGQYLLDAGSGPVQYPEYLTYSQGYTYRVCLDLSSVALAEARQRLGERGLYVVGDVAHLPFKADAFDGIVSLHTLHHLPAWQQRQAYLDFFRTLRRGASMVVVNGWTVSPLMDRLKPLVRLAEKAAAWRNRRRIQLEGPGMVKPPEQAEQPTGTFVQKRDAAGLKAELKELKPEIRVWRSLSVRFLRAVIKEQLGGRFWLRLVYGLEERFPHYFGEAGQYPLVIIQKLPG